jgi:hypothetical protein
MYLLVQHLATSATCSVPTRNQFQDYVAQLQVSYYIVPESAHDFPVGRDAHADMANWVVGNFPSTKVGSTPSTT